MIQLEEEAYAEINKLLFHRMCAVISNPIGVQESSWEASAELLRAYVKHHAPWIKLESKEDLQKNLRASWERAHGNISDPEVAAAIDNTARMLIEQADTEIRKAAREN